MQPIMCYNYVLTFLALQPKKPIWQDTIFSEERELEKAGLTHFNRKANYLRNSRYSKTKWSNTASSGPIKMRQREQLDLNEKYVTSV